MQLKTAHKKNVFPNIVVCSFSTSAGGVSQLTEDLSAEFSSQLSAKLDKGRVVERPLLMAQMKIELLNPLDLQDRAIATWIAEKVGANTVVFGTISLDGATVGLQVSAVFISDRKLIAESKGTLALTPDLEALADKALPGPNRPRLQVGCDQASGRRTQEQFRNAGVEVPKCIRCPDPSYSDEARRRKFQGTIALNVIVDEKGNTRPLSPVSSASRDPIDMDLVDGVLNVIRTWKFHAATKDGEPVAVCVPVEISFRLF